MENATNTQKTGFKKYEADLETEKMRVAKMTKKEQAEHKRQRRILQRKWDNTAYY